mgnify:CR=1 FL=1
MALDEPHASDRTFTANDILWAIPKRDASMFFDGPGLYIDHQERPWGSYFLVRQRFAGEACT